MPESLGPLNTSSAIIILCTCLSINTNSCMKSNIEANGPHRSPEHEKTASTRKTNFLETQVYPTFSWHNIFFDGRDLYISFIRHEVVSRRAYYTNTFK